MDKVWVINGPNLNLLGQREPERYGTESLGAIEQRLIAEGDRQDIEVTCFQSNAEHQLVDWVQASATEKVLGIILNAAAYTHTSIAIRDALLAVQIPFIEVHITNPAMRESFRHHSMLSDIALEVIQGQGTIGYSLALEALIRYRLTHKKTGQPQ